MNDFIAFLGIIMVVIVGMQTMKFRRSRVVILVLLLITVSSLGYWLMYVTSRPQSDLSELHDYVDTHHRYRHKHVPERSIKDTNHIDLQEHDSHRNKDTNSFQHNEVLGRHAIVNHVDERVNELKENEKYDYSNEEETIDDAMPAMNNENAADAGHQRRHEDNVIPVAVHDDNDEGDDYHDINDENFRKKPDADSAPDSAKNKEEVPGVDHEYETLNEVASEGGQGKQQVENVGDSYDKQQHGDRARIDQHEAASAMELRQKQDVGAKQHASWKEDNELGEVDIGGLNVQPQKSQHRDKTNEQRDDVWRSQQLNDGVRASHLRSHNVAPVPRVHGSSVLDNVDTQKPLQPTQRSGFDDVVSNIDNIEPPRRNVDSSSSSNYFIIHSGSASRVHGVMQPSLHALPDHIQPEAYIFTSNRFDVKIVTCFYCTFCL